MRDIKFKVWDTQAKMFLKNEFPVSNLNGGVVTLDGVSTEGDATQENEEVIFLQFTGLKDKNDKEIYEGDLITHLSRNGGLPHPVIFKNGAFCGDYGLVYPLHQEHFDKYCEIVVVGNIYENPELIK